MKKIHKIDFIEWRVGIDGKEYGQKVEITTKVKNNKEIKGVMGDILSIVNKNIIETTQKVTK